MHICFLEQASSFKSDQQILCSLALTTYLVHTDLISPSLILFSLTFLYPVLTYVYNQASNCYSQPSKKWPQSGILTPFSIQTCLHSCDQVCFPCCRLTSLSVPCGPCTLIRFQTCHTDVYVSSSRPKPFSCVQNLICRDTSH